MRTLVRTTVFRLTLSIAAGFTAMAMALFGFIYWQTAVHVQVRIDGLLTRESLYIASGPPAGAAAAVQTWLIEDLHSVRYAGLFSAAGDYVSGNLLDAPTGLAEDGKIHRSVFSRIDRDHDGDEPEAVRAIAMRLSDGRLLVLGYDIDELEDVNDVILRALALGLLPMVLLSLTCGIFLARRAQGRIASIHEALDRIMRGHLGERLPVRGSGDDLDYLTKAVNKMLQEFECLVVDIRGIGDNIAHDLRTPLTRVRARLERGREEAHTLEASQIYIDRAIQSVDQALAVISAILRIGEIEHSRRKAAFRSLDLSEVAIDAFELYEPLAEEKGLTLSLDVAERICVFGDRDLLLEATGNLLDNAIKFAPVGTVITLSVAGEGVGGYLRVADRGPGIPVEERSRVLRRFYRGEKSRTVDGSGLGLNLVSAVVSLHGFQLTIGDARPGCEATIHSFASNVELVATDHG